MKNLINIFKKMYQNNTNIKLLENEIIVLPNAPSLTLGNSGSWREGRNGQRVWK